MSAVSFAERFRVGATGPRRIRARLASTLRSGALPFAIAVALATALPALADVPFPRCDADAGCSDPYDYPSYLFIDPAQALVQDPSLRIPNDFDPNGGGGWKYLAESGMNVIEAWGKTTGRPDVVVAVLDSGIRWDEPDLRRKAALNTDELPVPTACPPPASSAQHSHDCNGDGVVNVRDFQGQLCAGGTVSDEAGNQNGVLDPQDLILLCSDGVDGVAGSASPVANGYVDDISGWDFFQDDNDPFDDTDYGHGTGQAEDSTGEADNRGAMPGVAPNALFLPLRVGDSFVAVGTDFAQAVVYAVDVGAHVIQEALGTVSQSASGQGAIDYAYANGVPVIASAADEESRHHNYPANYEHTIWMNSVRDGDGTIAIEGGAESYLLLNGCTNYGGRAWSAISSTSCSSEATGRGAGLAALLVSHGLDLVDADRLEAFDAERRRPFSAEEVRQIFRAAAEDVDFGDDLALGMDPLIQAGLSRPEDGLVFQSTRFPTQDGWDQFTGHGRPDLLRMLEIAEGEIPPEADLSGGPGWFEVIDPDASPKVKIRGSASAWRSDGWVKVSVQVGCGVQPESYEEIASERSMVGFDDSVLARWKPAKTARRCGFDPSEAIEDPDAHSVTLRLVVRDRDGRVGIDRRTVSIHSDPTLRFAPVQLGASGESGPALADIDRDGVLDVILAASSGEVWAIDGKKGTPLSGFPARTDAIAVHPSPGYAPGGGVPLPHEPIIAAAAADDLDGDGRIEIVVASTEGGVYAFDDQGLPLPGFPVRTDPELSRPDRRDRFNDADPGIFAAPTLANLDGDEDLEILASAADGHLYVWHHDGSPASGFPVRIADPAEVSVEPGTGFVTPLPGRDVGERLTKMIGSPAVGDLDADGTPEIVVTTNEEYGGSPGFGTDSALLALLLSGAVDLDGFDLDTAGRVYAVQANGSDHPSGPFRPGWPAVVPMIVSQLLPNVATGVPGTPALADLDPSDDDDSLAVAIFGAVGPAMLFDADGAPILGVNGSGAPVALAADFPGGGFLNGVPDSVGSPDGPFFASLGSGAFGDLDGDGKPEFVAATGGVRKLIDVAAPGNQQFGDHQITAWNPRTGALHGESPEAPGFPQRMDDMQFFSSPALADVDGDGRADVVQGSGAYLLRAYASDGSTPEGWPKFTHGWIVASPVVGDVDGDALLEVVVVTREGWLFVWDTEATASWNSVQWQGFARDRRNSGNWSSGVPLAASPSTWVDGLLYSLRRLASGIEGLGTQNGGALAGALDRSGAPEIVLAAIERFGDEGASADPAILLEIDQSLRSRRKLRRATDGIRKEVRQAARDALSRAVSSVACPAVVGDPCAKSLRRASKALQAGKKADRKGESGKALARYVEGLGRLRGS